MTNARSASMWQTMTVIDNDNMIDNDNDRQWQWQTMTMWVCLWQWLTVQNCPLLMSMREGVRAREIERESERGRGPRRARVDHHDPLVYICVYMYTHIHTCMYVCMYLCVCACSYSYIGEKSRSSWPIGIWVIWNTYIYMYVCVYMYTHINTYMYVYQCSYMGWLRSVRSIKL